MIEIKLEETHTLTLEMHIDGDVRKEDTQLRFSVLAEGVRYSFNSRQRENGVYEIDFPQMQGKIVEGEYPAEVEIIVDGKYFVPLEETVKFTKEIKPTVKLAETISTNTSKFKVEVGKVKIHETVSISDVKALMTAITNNGEMDTELGLKCLEAMASNRSITESSLAIKPKKPLTEAEAVAAIRVLKAHGSDVSDISKMDGLVGLSERTKSEVKSLLSEKGISSKKLKTLGF